MDILTETLHYIGQNKKDTKVIQIGAMDGISFDDFRGYLDMYSWEAILVEPIPHLFEELKENFKDRDNYTFVQAAITNTNGTVEMLTIPVESIKKEDLHPGYKGMSTLYPPKNGFGSDYQRDIDVQNNFGVTVKVPSMTLDSLMKKYHVRDFDIFVCDAEGYDWEILQQLDLSKYKPKVIFIEYNTLTEEDQLAAHSHLRENGYQSFDNGKDLSAIRDDIYEIVLEGQSSDEDLDSKNEEIEKEDLDSKNEEIEKEDLTVVTGLWNINRDILEGLPARSWDHYIESFQQLLDIPQNMFIYIPKEYEYLVWEKRKKSNTYVKTYELSDIRRIFKPHWDKCQEIRTSDEWINITGKHGWLTKSPQCLLEWYNPIVMSKMPMLNDATIWNPFDTNHFMWIDAGITNTVWHRHLVQGNALSKIVPYLDSFLFLSYPYQPIDEVHGFKSDEMEKITEQKIEYVCRGGLFGGSKEFINEANGLYYSLLDRTLNDGLMGTEECIFTIMSYLHPDVYKRYALDIDGAILKFIKSLLNDNVTLEKVKNIRSLDHVPKKRVSVSGKKMSVYMLSFNFPQQVESTIKTWLKHPKWITDTRNILIDNSTNEKAIKKNKELCEKYNFEHIVTNENLGINGGRFLAAKHFQESDSDYYLFLEDDMEICSPSDNGFCRNGFRKYIPDLYSKVLKIMEGDDIDFLKLSFTEVYMDNNIQVSWYNVPQHIRTKRWPHYDQLPITGIDDNCPRTKFDTIEVMDGLSYIKGEIYYANWPMIVGKKGNQKMFLDITWTYPYEQTWMSQMYQDTIGGKLKPAILLASPINHNRIVYYKPEERKENAG